ncbi:hypothetical protein EDD22DRAFT_850974 [Suillus occidentalis]|nr:hypothetical protein EDD22DRAFT_850974 [Suillus occidentalis]
MAKHAASKDGAPTLKCIRMDDRNQTTPLADKHAWAILEQFLTTDMIDGDDELALANLCAVKAKHIHPASFAPKDSSMADRRLPSSKNPYLNLAAEEDEDEENENEKEDEKEDEGEDEGEDEEEDEDDHTNCSESWKVTSFPGLSSAARFAAAINEITNRFKVTQSSSSQDRQTIPSSISGLIPLPGLQDGRMDLIHVQYFIAAHLRRKKFAVKVSAWIANQLYVVADSPKTIADSLPFLLYLTVEQYVVITDEEHELVECSCSKLPNPVWVRIKQGKYKGDIAQVFDSDLPNDLVVVLGSWSLLDRSCLLNRDMVSDINRGDEVVGCWYKGERYYIGLLLHNFHRDRLEYVICPHVNDIELHLRSGWDKSFLKSTVVAFSMQFLHAGDWAKIVKGDLSSEVGKVTSTNHTIGSATLDLSLSGHQKEVEYDSKEEVKVEVSKYYLDQHPLGHMQQAQPPIQQLFTPPTDVESIQIGDCVEVLVGEHIGKCDIVHWLPKGGDGLWFQDGTFNIPVPMAVVWRTCLPHLQTLQFMKDKGYDVGPGNIVDVPTSFMMKIHNASLDSFKQDIGQEVFIIGGDHKGY